MANFEASTMLYPPEREALFFADHIKASLPESADLHIERYDMRQHMKRLDERGLAYVGMNKAGHVALAEGVEGLVATSSLDGCTGAGGFAKSPDGTVRAFTSHFTPRAEALAINEAYFEPLQAMANGRRQDIIQRSAGFVVPTVHNLVEFIQWAAKEGAEDIQLFVGYSGQREDFYRMFGLGSYIVHRYDVVAAGKDTRKQLKLLHYDDMGKGHTLAAGRYDGEEGVFWDGKRVDF